MEQARALLQDVDYESGAYDFVEGAEALVIVTEGDAFRALDLGRVKRLMKSPVVVGEMYILSVEDSYCIGYLYKGDYAVPADTVFFK